MTASPIDTWNSLLRPDVELGEPFWNELSSRMRAAKLTFGERLNCPFLRPCFIDAADEAHVRTVAETMARLGERVASQALDRPDVLERLCLSPDEERLARLGPRGGLVSTASRLDAFLLPGSMKFAEYNAESPAGLGYSELLGEIFASLPIAQRFREHFHVTIHPLMERMLVALLETYREWGGRANPPRIAIVDWREVPTWSEFEILKTRFDAQGVPTVVCDPRDLDFDGRVLSYKGLRIDMVYRRVLVADVVHRPAECEVLVKAYAQGAVCMANPFRCKLPHKKSFFALLTDDAFAELLTDDERAIVQAHVPWTRVLREGRTRRNGRDIDILAEVRARKDEMVIKPNDEYGGSGVTLGWEVSAGEWDTAIAGALAEASAGDGGKAWIVQERIAVRRESFPMVSGAPHRVEQRDMLVDFAPYLFRGRLAGYLTRLSSTGLANVTSGGGQVPVFVTSRPSP